MDGEKIVKSSQEQAVASWMDYLNQIRIDRFMESLAKEEDNLDKAMSTIHDTFETISKDIVNKGNGRGGIKGMHGFIAEVAESGIGNARSIIDGGSPVYEWIDNNGVSDLKRGDIFTQMKFYNDHLSLRAIHHHLEAYPDFLDNGGVYQIPADQYEKIKELMAISKDEANKLPTSTGEFSLKQWQEVHDFFEKGDISIDDIEPSALKYGEVQKNTYENTLHKEEQNLKERNKERKNQAYEDSKPTLKEGLKATAAAAAVEGGMAFCMCIIQKRRDGKRFKDFSEDDWKEIAGDTGFGFIKGGIRGSSIYMLTNYTATPAAVASAIVTASFGVAEQAHLYRKGELDETAFLVNSEMLCMDAAVSALSSFAGQVIIPVPILGAVVGNAVGTILYKISQDSLSAKEQKLIEGYLNEIEELDRNLDTTYKTFVQGIAKETETFMGILEKAFDPDISIAFNASIELAKNMGVPAEEILDSKEKIAAYFLD